MRLALVFFDRRLVACHSLSRPAQGTKADYARAAELPNLTRDKVFRDRVEPHWFDENRQFWYKVRTGPGKP